MKKLELEYDYDTEEEQLNAAKKMLLRENLDAIQYSVQDGDPLLLVENLHYQGPLNKYWLTNPSSQLRKTCLLLEIKFKLFITVSPLLFLG
mgnify:CR=1 FL=1